MTNNDELPDDLFSDDPEENLRMENELLRLKLKAELGAESQSPANIDPEIENQFLKNILAFEHSYANAKRIKIYDLLGQPDFKNADELSDELIFIALQEVTDLLAEKNIEVYFGDGYNDRTKYSFITGELFEHETDDLTMPGMTTHFDYEEFHPNHKRDIENRAMEFLDQWFKRTLDEKSWELASEFILPDGKMLGKSAVAGQLKNIFNAYRGFTNDEYHIRDIGYELEAFSGLGYAEGAVKYKAVLENGEVIDFAGPFKLYLTLEQGWWSIFHIVFPGFRYSEE